MQAQDNAAAPADFSGWKRKATLFLASQTISLFGSSLVQFAIIWHITLTTKSGSMMTLSSLFAFAPQIAVSLFAGVWADRYSRKWLILLADAAIALATLVLALVLISGHYSIWLIMLVSGIRSLGSGIQSPAVGAILPQIVPPGKLMRVNGINGSIQSLILLLSPAASGALLSVLPLEYTLFVDVLTAATAVIIMLQLAVPMHQRSADQPTQGGYFTDLRAGLRYISGTGFVKELLVFYGLFFFFLVPCAYLTPLLVARTFGDEVWRQTANEMLFSAGSILGGVLIAAWGGFRNRMATVAAACVLFGICTLLLGVVRSFWLYLAVMLVTGLFVPFFSSSTNVLLQEKIEPEMQGRVFSLVQLVATTVMPLGMVLFGPLSDAVAIELMMVLTGLLLAALGVAIPLNRNLWRAGEPLP